MATQPRRSSGDGGQGPLGAGVVAAEVGPPQAGGQQQAEHGHAGQGQVDREAGGADADGHDRLAEGDDHHQAVALHEVGRGDPEAAGAGEAGGEPLQREGGRPQQVGGGALDHHGGQDQQGRDEVERGQAEQRPDGVGIGGARVEPGVDAHDHQVGDPEGDVALGEGPRDGQGQDQEPGHAAEQQQPPGRPVGRDGVGQPGVAAVHVEDHPQHEHHPQQPPRGRVVAQHRRSAG